jgi:hypothetical protein
MHSIATTLERHPQTKTAAPNGAADRVDGASDQNEYL